MNSSELIGQANNNSYVVETTVFKEFSQRSNPSNCIQWRFALLVP